MPRQGGRWLDSGHRGCTRRAGALARGVGGAEARGLCMCGSMLSMLSCARATGQGLRPRHRKLQPCAHTRVRAGFAVGGSVSSSAMTVSAPPFSWHPLRVGHACCMRLARPAGVANCAMHAASAAASGACCPAPHLGLLLLLLLLFLQQLLQGQRLQRAPRKRGWWGHVRAVAAAHPAAKLARPPNTGWLGTGCSTQAACRC